MRRRSKLGGADDVTSRVAVTMGIMKGHRYYSYNYYNGR